jgi:hypothetical protein
VDSLQKLNMICIQLFALVITAVSFTACTTTAALPDPLAAGWNGVPVCERLHEDADQRILRCTFPPGVGHERHYHAPNFGYAVSGGQMQITDETGVREVDLPDGGAYPSAGIEWHEVLNIGATTVVFLIIEAKR